ncbi:MAG: hypothetical protein ACHQK8_06245 [Bacteroidia bacterium]
MLKKIFLFSFALFSGYQGFSQIIQQRDMKPLFRNIEDEKWDSAFIKANAILKKFKKDSSDYKAVANYAAVLAAAGLVSQDKMSYDSLYAILHKFLGKRLMMPMYPVTTDTLNIGHNRTYLKENDAKIYGATNMKGTKSATILSIEHFEFADVFEIGRFRGENARCSGILSSYELNHHGDKYWVMRLFFKNAVIVLIKPRN